jgi:hypothetical protein
MTLEINSIGAAENMSIPEDTNSPVIRAIGQELYARAATHGRPDTELLSEVDDGLTITGLVNMCALLDVSAPDLLAKALAHVEAGEHAHDNIR